MDIPAPADPEKLKVSFGATSQTIFPIANSRSRTTVTPGMHITDTVDYAIILFGEMYAVLEDGTLDEGGRRSRVQRGTNSTSSSGKTCRVAFILIDGRR